MINPFDTFGEQMLSNLSERGCDLYGIEACPSLETQISRLKQYLSMTGVEFSDFVVPLRIEVRLIYETNKTVRPYHVWPCSVQCQWPQLFRNEVVAENMNRLTRSS